jgi:hypothetical protein
LPFDLTEFEQETDSEDLDSSDLEVEIPAEEEEEAQEEGESDVELDNYMSEVDKRLEVASFYRALLKNPLFNGTRDKGSAATVVEKEVRAFCRSRLAVLMGLKPETSATPTAVSSPFTTEQTEALIAVANKLIANSRTIPLPVVMPAEGKGPVVNTVPTGGKPAAKVAPKATIKPKVNKKGPVKPLYVEKEVLDQNGAPVIGSDGKPVVQKKSLVQKPAGMTPFPQDVAAATEARLRPASSGSMGVGTLGFLVQSHMKD